MPLFIDTVSKININRSLIINPSKDILYKHLTNGRQIVHRTNTAIPHKYNTNTNFYNMTTEQKRKYLLLKYVRQYT